MTAAADLPRLLALSRHLYTVLLEDLPSAHCKQVAKIISTIASALNLEHTKAAGYWHQPDGSAVAIHYWVRVGDLVLHSPSRGSIEAVDAAPFEPTNSVTLHA